MAVKKNTLLIVAGSLLILLLIGVTILLISEKQTKDVYKRQALVDTTKGNGSNVKGLDISAKGTFTNSGWLKLSEVTVK